MQNDPRAGNLRAKHAALVAGETTTTQLRFQMVSLFIAAVGFIVGLADQSRRVGLLLLVLCLGLWILDLRNRHLVQEFKKSGRTVEEQMTGVGGFFVDRPLGRIRETRFGLLDDHRMIRDSPFAGLLAYQVGIDVLVLGVAGYALVLASAVHGPWAALVLAAPLLTVAALRSFWQRWLPAPDSVPESARIPSHD